MNPTEYQELKCHARHFLHEANNQSNVCLTIFYQFIAGKSVMIVDVQEPGL